MLKKPIYLEERREKKFFRNFLIFIIFLWIFIFIPPYFYLTLIKESKVAIFQGIILFYEFSKFTSDLIKERLTNILEKSFLGYYSFYSYFQKEFLKKIKVNLELISREFAKIPKISFKLPKIGKDLKEAKFFVSHQAIKIPSKNENLFLSIQQSSILNEKKVTFFKEFNKTPQPKSFSASLFVLKDKITQQEEIDKAKELKKESLDIELIQIPNLTAEGILVKSFSGKEFFSKNKEKNFSLASLTKLMTSIIAFENYKEDEIFQIKKEHLNLEGDVGLILDEKFDRNSLLYFVLLSSSNDAAVALTEKLGIEKFVELMNKKAKEIGMENTLFVDPTGIDTANKSTLQDLYLLVKYILVNHPEILKMTTEKEKVLISQEGYVHNIKNRIINFIPEVENFNFLGGKTGYLPSVGYNLITVFDFGEPIIMISLGEKNSYKDSILKFLNHFHISFQ